MAAEPAPVGGVNGNGINLANYFPHQRSFNTVVYLHKRFLDLPKDVGNNEAISKKTGDKKKKDKRNKGQQFNGNQTNTDNLKSSKSHKVGINNDSVVEHTIKFAKDIVPFVIPARDKSPVFYTVKTTKKSKRKSDKPHDLSYERIHDGTYKKSKQIIETYRKEYKSNRESLSIKESISHSENDTLNDLNMNQSLSCTFSEVSERKYHKKGNVCRNKPKDTQKFALSQSFEALATEMNTSGDTKIKIHLMNDQDKHILNESIRVPIMNAIKECLLELNTNDISADVKTAQRFIKCNSQKLDNILEKLTSIERKLDEHAKTQSPKVPFKASTLEQLGEDLLEVHETSEEEEVSQRVNKSRNKGALAEIIKTSAREKRKEEGCGEVTGRNASCSTDVLKLDRPNRIPARFCWTDADR